MSDLAKQIVVRPAVSPFLRAAGARLLTFGGLTLFFVIQLFLSSRKEGAIALVTLSLGVLLVLAAFWHILYLLNVQVEVANGHVSWVDRFGRRRVQPLGDVGGLAGRSVTWEGVPAPPATVFVMYDRAHRSIAVFPNVYWKSDDMHALSNALGAPGLMQNKQVDVKVLAREFPGSVPFWQRHNWLTAGVVVAGLGVLFFWLLAGR